MKREQLEKYIEERAGQVDEALERLIAEEITLPQLREPLSYALGLDLKTRKERGKRLRPVLCLLSCQLLGGDPQRAMPLAMAIELMHNYFLIHDDIEDGDLFRRGRPAVWHAYGLPDALNLGDYVHSYIYGLLIERYLKQGDAELGRKLLELLWETLYHTHLGQALDIAARQRDDLSLDDYLEITREKTGYYLAAPLVGGAMIAGAEEQVLNSLREFGHYLGPLFQIMDDLIDLSSGKGREAIGADIKEGKRSFMVVYTLGHATGEEKQRLVGILNKQREETTESDIKWAIGLFERYGALEEARRYCQQLGEKSTAVLKSLPAALCEALSSLSELLGSRQS